MNRPLTSLRDSLNAVLTRDRRRADNNAHYPILLKKQRKATRRRGWSWVPSRHGAKGAVRYRWNPQLKILECWAVTSHGNRPSQLMGEFVETLLDSRKAGVKSIHIEVG